MSGCSLHCSSAHFAKTEIPAMHVPSVIFIESMLSITMPALSNLSKRHLDGAVTRLWFLYPCIFDRREAIKLFFFLLESNSMDMTISSLHIQSTMRVSVGSTQFLGHGSGRDLEISNYPSTSWSSRIIRLIHASSFDTAHTEVTSASLEDSVTCFCS